MRTRARQYVGAAVAVEAEAQRLRNEDEARRAEWRRRIEAREQEQARAARVAPVQAAAPVGAPVQEAARVANPRLQRVHLPRTAGVPDELWLNFLKYLVEQGFSYVDRDTLGAVYERVRPE